MKIQEELFDRIAGEYQQHFDDKWGIEYRKKFVYPYMFKDIEIKEKIFLEAMCGAGETAKFLLGLGARVHALDLSLEQLTSLKKSAPSMTVHHADIIHNQIPDNTFDFIVILGGLHHLHPNMELALARMVEMLKVGGHLSFFEPCDEGIFNFFRKIWYQLDRSYFASNEAAINIDKVQNFLNHRMILDTKVWGGGIAYLLIYNSLIFRMSHRIKNVISPILFLVDRLLHKFISKHTAMYCICRFQKKA